MAESRSGGHRLDSDILTFDDLLEAMDAVPPDDVIEWYGMSLILAAEEDRKGFNPEVIKALLLGLLTRRTPEQTQEMIRRAKRQ